MPGMPPMPPMPGMGGPMGAPPEIAGLLAMLGEINQPTAGDKINEAIQLLTEAKKMDDKIAPVVARAIDILKGSCSDTDDGDDDSSDPTRSHEPSSKEPY